MSYENDPFVPVVVNVRGEAIRPHHRTDGSGFAQRVENEDFFREHFHLVCEGIASISRVTDADKVVHCPKCGLREYFPKEVRTYAQLRAHFAKFQKRPKRRR